MIFEFNLVIFLFSSWEILWIVVKLFVGVLDGMYVVVGGYIDS